MSKKTSSRTRRKKRPWFQAVRAKPENQRALQIVADMHESHKTIPATSPQDYMENQTILVAGCKEVCFRYRIPWRLVELRALVCNETRSTATIAMCNKCLTRGRLPMHVPCKGGGCKGCANTGLDHGGGAS